MAKIKRIFFNGVQTYPLSISDAIIDTETNKTLTVRLKELEMTPISEQDVQGLMTNGNSAN